MVSNDRIRTRQEEMDHNDPFDVLLVDFVDGTLSDESSEAVRTHLSVCSPCTGKVHSMLQSRILTERMKSGRTVYLETLPENRRQQQIEDIKLRITKEQRLSESEKESARHNLPGRPVISFFTNPRALTSTAAAIVVLLFISFLFLNGNSPLGQFFRNTGSNAILSPVNTKGGKDSTSGGIPEFQATEQALSTGVDTSAKEATQDVPASITTLPPSFTSEGIREASIRLLIAPDHTQDWTTWLQGAVAYLEVLNTGSSCQFIASYPSSMIPTKEEGISNIKENWGILSLTIKFEFISRENAQKLVEYTSKENATLLQTNADTNAADFLVISIYRG